MVNNMLKQAQLVSRVLFLFVVFCASTAQAALTLSVDRNPVALNESFTLTLESNESLDQEPDFSILESDFDILNRQQSSSFQMINGRTSRSITWQLTLIAKHSGTLTIPAVQVGAQQSNAIQLKVLKVATSPASGNSGDLFVEIETTPDDIYIQQQLLLTIKLYFALDSGINIAKGSSLSEPELEYGDAVIKKLGEDTDYQSTRNGRPYRVIQRQYVVYPQKSGELSIKPIVFEGHIIEQTRRRYQMFNPFQQTTRIKRIQSDALKLMVKQVPSNYRGKHWLPASNLQLAEDWSEKDWIVGEPLTRTIALFADSLTSAQLPAIEFGSVENIKQYPDQPILKDTESPTGFNGVRQEKVALIPTQPGTIIFPEINIVWWNTETGQQQTASLPARTVTILPSKDGSTNPGTTADSSASIAIDATSDASSNDATITPATDKITAIGQTAGWWPWLSLFLALAWFLTVFAWWRQRRTGYGQKQPAREKDLNRKQLEQQIKQACHTNDPEKAQQALLKWARCIWPEHSPVSLGEIANRINNPGLTEQMNSLSQALYGKTHADWNGTSLWQAFHHSSPKKNPADKVESPLAPLYPG